jgi:hypothetical protein
MTLCAQITPDVAAIVIALNRSYDILLLTALQNWHN